MGIFGGLSLLLFTLLQSSRLTAGELLSKCKDERVNISCPSTERIWIKETYSCSNCRGKCEKPRYESSDSNLLWELCNLRDVCDLTVTWYRLVFDYECVPLERIPMYNICTQGEIEMKAFYLYSPGYPEDLSHNRHCECYTELNKPTNFTLTVHQGRFQFPELEIKLDNFVRGPLSLSNLPIPKEMFKVVYKNNNKNKDHRLWIKISVIKDVTLLTCRDVNAMPSGGGGSTTNAGSGGWIIAMIGVGCVVGTLFVLIPAVIIYRRKRRAEIKAAEVGVGSQGSGKGDHIRDKMMLNLYGPQHQAGPKQNSGVAQTEFGTMKENDLYGSGEDVPGDQESHAYQVAEFNLRDKDVCGRYMRGSNVYAYADVKVDSGNSHMKENDLYQPTDFSGGNDGQHQGNIPTEYQAANDGSVGRRGEDLSHIKVNDSYQPTDYNGDVYMKDNDLYYPADVTGYNRRPRSLPRPGTLPKPRTLPKPVRKSVNDDNDATLPKSTRVSDAIYQDIDQ